MENMPFEKARKPAWLLLRPPPFPSVRRGGGLLVQISGYKDPS